MTNETEPEGLPGSIRSLSGAWRYQSLILFLPGITGNLDQWMWVRESLQNISADLAFGTPVLPYVAFGRTIPSVTEASNAMANEVQAAHHGKVLIVSHSGGAFSALGTAHKLGSAVKVVILVNGGLTRAAKFLDHPIQEFITRPLRCLKFMHLFLLVCTPAPEWLKKGMTHYKWLARLIVGKLVSESALETPERRAALVNEAGGLSVLVSLWKNRHHWRELVAYADEICTDVLIIVGDKDPVSTLEDTKAMTALLPRAKIRVIKGVSHAAPLEAPDVIADIVREALRSEAL
jgi:pimeloyl-ACP methyl ester carboxylesterase